jgi:hypothetical protein
MWIADLMDASDSRAHPRVSANEEEVIRPFVAARNKVYAPPLVAAVERFKHPVSSLALWIAIVMVIDWLPLCGNRARVPRDNAISVGQTIDLPRH